MGVTWTIEKGENPEERPLRGIETGDVGVLTQGYGANKAGGIVVGGVNEVIFLPGREWMIRDCVAIRECRYRPLRPGERVVVTAEGA